MRIFCDGVFDLFHHGHVNHFKQIKEIYINSFLIVGILNDIESTKYKRKPLFNQEQRKDFVESCKYVDETTHNYPIILTEEFINENNIDLVVHAFSNKDDFKNQLHFFDVPIKLNKFKHLDYDKSISTTNIIKNIKQLDINKIINVNKTSWDLIWEKKGNINDNNLYNLNGYDDTTFKPEISYNQIINLLKLPENSKILEIGCGAGLLSKLFCEKYNYFGIDYSSTLIEKNIKIVKKGKVYNCEAKDLPFKDKYFDYTFSVGVFEYFPSKEYMKDVLKEIERVTKKGICILNIRNKTHLIKKKKHIFQGTFTHQIYNHEDFKELNYNIIDANYELDNIFSVYKFL
jgi:cytidyltransferase-like protein